VKWVDTLFTSFFESMGAGALALAAIALVAGIVIGAGLTWRRR
jgi:hypothetical protein